MIQKTRSAFVNTLWVKQNIDKLFDLINGNANIKSTHFARSTAKNKLQQLLWNTSDYLQNFSNGG
jgi:hypothetical protein